MHKHTIYIYIYKVDVPGTTTRKELAEAVVTRRVLASLAHILKSQMSCLVHNSAPGFSKILTVVWFSGKSTI
jgi:predicted anti-sigma-YlaC factor YlaD